MDNIIHHKFTLNNWYILESPVLSSAVNLLYYRLELLIIFPPPR